MKDMDRLPAPAKAAPETWEPARRIADRVIRPIEHFLHIEAASGLLLLGAAVIALVWANSRFSHSYEALWHLPVTLGVGGLESRQTLHFWINEGLMTIFFFVVGLEIRREIHEGELSDLRRAALPVAAALGGMLVPALIYFLLNPSGPSRQGWGVPMATDIAFAVGILALLGKRVPPALRVLLLALAIIDDIGAIIVIAVFYSSGFSWLGVLLAAGGAAGVIALQRLGVRNALVYVAPGAVIWVGMLKAGIHPTIAGVILGLLTPARTWFGAEGFLAVANDALQDFKGATDQPDPHEAAKPLDRMRRAQREALAPAVRLQIALHPWVAYLIMPIFALANAGVVLSSNPFASESGVHVLSGVVLGLVLGKPVGIVLASFVAVKAGLCALPTGVSWRGVTVVGCVAGIGFTMAIFIAGLAFDSPEMLGTAKLGVLVASGAAALVGLTVGALALSKEPVAGSATSVDEAESLTDR